MGDDNDEAFQQYYSQEKKKNKVIVNIVDMKKYQTENNTPKASSQNSIVLPSIKTPKNDQSDRSHFLKNKSKFMNTNHL